VDLIDDLIARLRPASRLARIALVAECGDRVYPIYEEYWVGEYYESVRRSIDIGWSVASGANVDEVEIQTCLTEVQDLVNYYREEGIDVLGAAVTVVLRVLQSLASDEEAHLMAVARGLVSARDTAQSAEAAANQSTPASNRTKVAMREEEAWQTAALALIQESKGVPTRSMFDPLNDKPPKWLVEWRQRSRR
jgi:hypothetical protein